MTISGRVAAKLATVLAAGLTAATALALLGSPSSAHTAEPAAPDPDAPRWLTLITGDRVAVRTAGGSVDVVGLEPATGSAGIYRSADLGDTVRIVPGEAQPYVESGQLDAALFDVTTLARADAPTVVVREHDGDQRTVPVPSDQQAARALWTSLVGDGAGSGLAPTTPRLVAGLRDVRLAGATPPVRHQPSRSPAATQESEPLPPCDRNDNPNEPGAGKVPVTFTALDRRGEATGAALLLHAYECRPWEGYGYIQFNPGPTGRTFYLPPAHYSVAGDITTLDESGRFPEEVTIGGDLQLDVTGARDVVVDARDAVPLEAITPRESETSVAVLGWTRGTADNRLVNAVLLLPQYSPLVRMSVIPDAPVTHGEFDFYPVLRQTAPLVRVGVPQLPGLHPKLLPGGAQTAFDQRLPLVSADDACDGCAVLVREDPVSGIAGPAQQAAAAGAAAVLVMPAGPGAVHGSVGGIGVPALALPYTEGATLEDRLRRGRTSIDLAVTPLTPYLYDLALHEPGGLPADLSYDIDKDDVRRIDQRFHGDGTGSTMFETRYPTAPCRCSLTPILSPVQTGTTRVDYVSDNGSVWQHQLFRPGLTMRDGAQPYDDETPDTVDWLAGPLVPGLPRQLPVDHWQFPGLSQNGSLIFRVPTLTDTAGHAGNLGTTTGRLLRDGELVEELAFAGFATVPAGDTPATWRLELKHSHTPQQWASATSGQVAWTFRAGGETEPTPTALPMVDARIDLPVGLDGDPTRRGAVTIEPWRLDGVPIRVDAISLDVSTDDGATWQSQRLQRSRDGYTAWPRLAGDGPVSLRLLVTDRDGSAVERTIHHAWTR
ncbi:MAG: hypothetical protein ACRDO1_04350 [Nocardioidaceae bacterium]